VADGGVGERELAEVVANHLGLHLDEVVAETVVDADLRAEHLGEDDGVAEVGLNDAGLLLANGLGLGLGEALAEVLVDGAALEAAAGTGVNELDKVLLGDGEELLSLNAAVEILAERLLGIRLRLGKAEKEARGEGKLLRAPRGSSGSLRVCKRDLGKKRGEKKT
jgi:hypothetical protein